MRTRSRSLVSLTVIAALLAETGAPAIATARELSRADYEACQGTNEQSFRAAVEQITLAAMSKGLADFDYKGAVADAWRKNGLDEIVDKRVDQAVAEVQNETSTSDRLSSNVSAETAKQLAEKVAERVYRSDAVKQGVEALANDVGREVGKRIETASQDASEPAIACLNAFLGPRYGTAIARAVGADAGKELGLDSGKGTADLGTGAVLKQNSEGIAGAAILMVRRQLANMAARVSQRIVGSVLSRLVSVAAGGVGLVLIAKDVFSMWSGAFPLIASEMKSRDTKGKVQDELAKAMAEQIGEHVKEIAAKSAERVVEIWQEFRRAHVKVVDLAERSAPFKSYIDTLGAGELPRLDEITALVLAGEGESGITRRLSDGTFAEAVSKLPQPAMQIARDTRSLEAALGWNGLAGNDVARVVELELHRRAKPEDFTKASLGKTLALADRLAVTRVAGLKRDARDVLFELEASDLKALARALTETELDTLARYIMGLAKEPREAVMKAVAARPARMAVIGNERVRDAILTSRDQTAAVELMLREEPVIDPKRLMGDLRAAWDGRIAPILIYEKHPSVAVIGGGLLIILLLMVRRLFRPRARRATADAGAKS